MGAAAVRPSNAQVSSHHSEREQVVRLQTRSPLWVLLDDFTTRYRNPKDRQRQSRTIESFFAHAGKTHPSEIVGADLLRWVNDQQDLANNTLRSYTAAAVTFMKWAGRTGHCVPLDLTDEQRTLNRSYPHTSGKVQDLHDARRLTHDEAYRDLLGACKDGTWRGSRDQLAFRIGLLGIRVAEVTAMKWGDRTAEGTFEWIGKGRKPRKVRIGPTLNTMLDKWQRQYEKELGRPVRPDDPILVAVRQGAKDDSLHWGKALRPSSYAGALLVRAEAAGLGYVCPHDLRRTAADLLHRAGFRLQDIQQVLGHARPETTAKYLAAVDTDAIDRAALVLD